MAEDFVKLTFSCDDPEHKECVTRLMVALFTGKVIDDMQMRSARCIGEGGFVMPATYVDILVKRVKEAWSRLNDHEGIELKATVEPHPGIVPVLIRGKDVAHMLHRIDRGMEKDSKSKEELNVEVRGLEDLPDELKKLLAILLGGKRKDDDGSIH